ncbi:MAG: DUF5362 family protein [Bacillota bacterium]|jgi:hypothetical protein
MFDRENLGKLGKWAGFVGVMTLIGGVMQILSIVGIISGILFIILGVKLLGAKSSAKAIAAYGGEMPTDQLNKMVNDLRVYFQINGILIIIGLVLSVLILIAGVIGLFTLPWEEFVEITY